MRLSDWSSLPPADFLINLGDLKGVKDIRGTEHRIRDNHIAQQRAWFGHEFSHGGGEGGQHGGVHAELGDGARPLGFLSDGTKARTSGEHYDTIVHFRDCTGRRSMEEVEAFLRGLKLVSKDRA